MKEEHIKDLIKKYKAGTSSLEEEEIIYDNDKVDSSIKMLSSFIKKTKKEAPHNINDKLWNSFDKKTSHTKKIRIGFFTVAASILLVISLFVNFNSENKLTNNQKEMLLSEAKSMFEDVKQEKIVHNIIIENDLIVVYTKTNK